MDNAGSRSRSAVFVQVVALFAATVSQAASFSDYPQNKDRAAQEMDQFVSSRDFSGVVLVRARGMFSSRRPTGWQTVSTTCRTK
jgi:hypothetical protein